MTALRVAVVGGGLAGITAALDCADAGASVALYESRPRLGGATFSIRRHGYWLDNGQHVALRCCTAYRSLLARLGVEDALELQPRLHVPVLVPGGRKAVLGRTALAAPFHLALPLIAYSHLSLRERLLASRAALALRRLDPNDRRLDQCTFGDWLRSHEQSERAIASLWNLIVLATMNLPADEASLQLACFVFRTGLLDASDACDLGVPRVPLRRLHGEPAAVALRERGARVELRADVKRIEPGANCLAVVLPDRTVEFDTVVCAVPHHDAAELLPEGAVDPARIAALGTSPIANVHLRFDRRVLDAPVAAAVGAPPLQWIFDRTRPAGVEEGQLLSLSISGAVEELGMTQAVLVQRCTDALVALLPRARGANLLEGTVTREPRATFRGVPGSADGRPGSRTPVPGLALAGAWTATGWPATMEGAVRSGTAAANVALAVPTRPARARAKAKAAA